MAIYATIHTHHGIGEPTEKIHVNYQEFVNKIENQKLAQVNLVGSEINAKTKTGKKVQLYKPEGDELTARLLDHDIPFNAEPKPVPFWESGYFYVFFPLLLIGIFVYFILPKIQNKKQPMMDRYKPQQHTHVPQSKQVDFSSVAGANEEKEELVEIVDFLKNPKKFTNLGARIPKGALLVGPPGTGKTLFARAIAGEAGVPFFSASGSDFVEMFVGVGASRVRELFKTAKENAPSIVFVDEIDAIARHRTNHPQGGSSEKEQTLNQLLVEMDGFEISDEVIVIGATNRLDILDQALLRPGRFDRHIYLNAPNITEREEILKVHAKGKPFDKEVVLKIIAQRTPGFTGADLENVINEAALLTGRIGKKNIGIEELEQAVDRVIGGLEKKSRVISETEKKRTACHEAGHALIGHIMPNTDTVHKVSIVPRGAAGGYTLMLPEEEKYFVTKTELLEHINVLLAGRIAEEILLKDVSSGAKSDLEKATILAKRMIMRYGMNEEIGLVSLSTQNKDVFGLSKEKDYSETIAAKIDSEIKDIINSCYQETKSILNNNKDKLEKLTHTLLEKEVVGADEINQL